MKENAVNIVIGGDVCPSGKIEKHFIAGNGEVIFQDLLATLFAADISVVNLECPLIVSESPVAKDGPCISGSPKVLAGFLAGNIKVLNLANNHIRDHGVRGIESTIAACSENGVSWFGAGLNSEEAGKVLIKNVKGIRLGFLGVAENEFCNAGPESAGANSVDVISTSKSIRSSRQYWDFLIVLVHGGREYFRYPSPRLQKFCRFLVDEGAGAVIVQHTHIVGCHELYRNRPIVYGQGNFIFEAPSSKAVSWNEGLLVGLEVGRSGKCRTKFIPFLQSLGECGARRMAGKEADFFLAQFQRRSNEIEEKGFVEVKWRNYCQSQKYLYASRVRGHSRLIRGLNKYLHFSDWLYSEATKLDQQNVVECETHREILETLWSEEQAKRSRCR